MAKLVWDATGAHLYETGISKGVLYVMGNSNTYGTGVAWNGLTAVTEKPTGADKTALYADNIKYLNLRSAEDFEGTIEAYTYPDEFKACNGELSLASGMTIGQQARKTFAFCYRTEVGNDTDGNSHGYKLHIVYGATCSPSERGYETINDSPSAITFSWDFSTVPVNPTEGLSTTPAPAAFANAKPTALIVLDSLVIGSTKMTTIENSLYGTDGTSGTSPTLLLPGAIYEIVSAT